MLRDMVLWGLGLEGDRRRRQEEEEEEGRGHILAVLVMVALSPALVGVLGPACMEEQEVVVVLDIPQVEVHAILVKSHHQLLLGVAARVLTKHLTRPARHQGSIILLLGRHHRNPHLK
jgi:hypothetical protein